MKCEILTEDRWERFLEHKLEKEELRECIEHFAEGGCPGCLQFMEQLDMATEDALCAEFVNEGKAEDLKNISTITLENDIARVQPGHRIPPSHTLSWKEKISSWFGYKHYTPAWAGGLAALLLVMVFQAPNLQQNSEALGRDVQRVHTLKGTATSSAVMDLRFAIGHHDINQELIVKEGIPGGKYHAPELLFLQYELHKDGYVYILSLNSEKDVELLFPEEAGQSLLSHAGQHDVPDNNHIRSVSLQGINGRYAVVSIYSSHPLVLNDQFISRLRQHIDLQTGMVSHDLQKDIDSTIDVDLVYFDVVPSRS